MTRSIASADRRAVDEDSVARCRLRGIVATGHRAVPLPVILGFQLTGINNGR
jgi:hypothetical protein